MACDLAANPKSQGRGLSACSPPSNAMCDVCNVLRRCSGKSGMLVSETEVLIQHVAEMGRLDRLGSGPGIVLRSCSSQMRG